MIQSFVDKAKQYDKRNVFSSFSGNLPNLPYDMQCFYKESNPVDVEVEYNAAALRFVPAEELKQFNQEYAYLLPQQVFATSNGDPFFLKDNKIYTCPHGIREPKLELLAHNFSDFIKIVTEQL